MKEGLKKAITKAGGQKALATLIGESQQKVWNWVHRDKGPVPPAEICLAIEQKVGVTRHELRPDIFGDQPQAAA